MNEMRDEIVGGTGGERIARFTLLLTGSGIICKILLLVFAILAADELGPDSYGQIEYLIEMALIFGVLIDFGLEQTITRDLAKWKDRFRAVAEATLGYRLLISVFVFAAMELVLSAIDLCTGDRVVYVLENSLAAVYCVTVFYLALAKAFLRSQEQLPAEAGINLADRTLLVIAGIGVLLWGRRVPMLLVVYIASSCLALILTWRIITRRITPCRPRWNLSLAFQWQRAAVPIGLSAACILLLHREDTAMVKLLTDFAETGVYKAAYRPFEGLFLFPQMLAVASYPVLASLYAREESITRLIAKFLRLLFYLSVPMAVGGTLIAGAFMEQLYPKYPDSVPVMVILIWSLPCIFGNFLLGTVLNAIDRQVVNFKASAWAMASNFLFNIPAILWYGARGAAAVTILSQALYFLLLLYHCRDVIEWRSEDTHRCLGMLASAAVMAVLLIFLPFAWYWEVLIGAAAYIVGLILFRGAVREDIDLLLSVVGRE
ncbi:MAG: flippase [bacterium]